MPKYTNITVSPRIYVSSTFHYYPYVHYKAGVTYNKSIDFDAIDSKPKYFQTEAREQLYRVLMSPDTKFYEHDRDGNRRYSEYRYHGAQNFCYFLTASAKDVAQEVIDDTWWNSISAACYTMKALDEKDFSDYPEVYTDLDIKISHGITGLTGINSAGERVILDLAAVAPWRPEFTIELRDSLNSMLTYVNSIRAEGAQNEEPSHHARALAAIEHIRATLNQLGESTPESES